MIALVALLAAAALASPPREVTLDDSLALLREHSEALLSARSAVDSARADVVDAGVLPNPTLGYSRVPFVNGIPTSGHLQETWQLDLPVYLAGQRHVRRAAARHRLDAAAADARAKEADLAREVRENFVALQAAQARVRILEEARADVERIEHILAARAEAGTQSPFDVARMELELANARARASEAASDEAAASVDLARAVGIPDWHPVALGEFAPAAVSTPDWATAQTHVPALAAAQAREEAAAAAVTVARRDVLPVPVLSAGRITTASPYGASLLFGLQIPLPLFDHNQGTLARARAESSRARHDRAAIEASAREAFEHASAQATRRETLETFEREAIAKLPELHRMAEDAYRNGQGGLSDLLDALRSITESRLTHVDLVRETIDAQIEELAASGS